MLATDVVPYSPISQRPSPMRQLVDKLSAAQTLATGATPYARAGLHALRAGGTSLVTGAALGAVDAKWGLDVKGHPVDGYLALASALASLLFAADPDGLHVEARSVMTVSAGVFAYRKARAWTEEKTKAAPARTTKTPSHQDTEDSILAAAAGLEDIKEAA